MKIHAAPQQPAAFEIAAAVYTGVWGLAMVVGSPAGWRLRPPPGALLLSWLFWAIVLAIKWAFEYVLVIKFMIQPSIALWNFRAAPDGQNRGSWGAAERAPD